MCKFLCNVNDTRALICLWLLVKSHLGQILDPRHSQAFTKAHIVIGLSLHNPFFYSSKTVYDTKDDLLLLLEPHDKVVVFQVGCEATEVSEAIGAQELPGVPLQYCIYVHLVSWRLLFDTRRLPMIRNKKMRTLLKKRIIWNSSSDYINEDIFLVYCLSFSMASLNYFI